METSTLQGNDKTARRAADRPSESNQESLPGGGALLWQERQTAAEWDEGGGAGRGKSQAGQPEWGLGSH